MGSRVLGSAAAGGDGSHIEILRRESPGRGAPSRVGADGKQYTFAYQRESEVMGTTSDLCRGRRCRRGFLPGDRPVVQRPEGPAKCTSRIRERVIPLVRLLDECGDGEFP